ncbi:hypothetical protein AB0A05_07710 [Streptomyces sp. NPDC046374]|uniref:hypothetical protein n=1 Tax=Streptomyces sp. NPDC046374 TaxID=3154917 RepID=UPI0033C2E1D6
MNRRLYCRCTRVRNFNYAQAARKLGCYQRWLEDNISRLPHQKYGSAPVFCECELALIQDMFTIIPAGVLEHAAAVADERDLAPKPDPVLSLKSIRPAGASRRTRTAS